MKIFRLLVVLLGLFALSGCVSEPVLELYGARVTAATPAGVQLTMMMKVTNNNSFDVKVRNVRASVTIANRYQLPYLQYNPDQWLNAGAATVLNVPMIIPWNLVGPLVGTSLGSNAVHYHILGYADVTAVRLLGIEKNDYKLDEDGVFSRMDLIMAAGRGILSETKSPGFDESELALGTPAWISPEAALSPKAPKPIVAAN